MSALIAHAKVLEALAAAYETEARAPATGLKFVAHCTFKARVHRAAAGSLRALAKAEASGDGPS